MVTIAIRRNGPITLADWKARGWLSGLTFIRRATGGTVARCPKCGELTGTGLVYQDGRYLRVLHQCESEACGHVWEHVARVGLS